MGAADDIEAWMCQGKAVNYRWLAQTLAVGTSSSKRMLHQYAAAHAGKLDVLYAIVGVIKQQGLPSVSVRLVPESQLDSAKAKFETITSTHVYSISKGGPIRAAFIEEAPDATSAAETLRCHRLAAIKCTAAKIVSTEEAHPPPEERRAPVSDSGTLGGTAAKAAVKHKVGSKKAAADFFKKGAAKGLGKGKKGNASKKVAEPVAKALKQAASPKKGNGEDEEVVEVVEVVEESERPKKKGKTLTKAAEDSAEEVMTEREKGAVLVGSKAPSKDKGDLPIADGSNEEEEEWDDKEPSKEKGELPTADGSNDDEEEEWDDDFATSKPKAPAAKGCTEGKAKKGEGKGAATDESAKPKPKRKQKQERKGKEEKEKLKHNRYGAESFDVGEGAQEVEVSGAMDKFVAAGTAAQVAAPVAKAASASFAIDEKGYMVCTTGTAVPSKDTTAEQASSGKRGSRQSEKAPVPAAKKPKPSTSPAKKSGSKKAKGKGKGKKSGTQTQMSAFFTKAA
ncbi:unnamed protein product [Chrysoparadoxa australica]